MRFRGIFRTLSEWFSSSLPDWMVTWLTPLWLVGLGFAAGLFACAVIWGVLRAALPNVGRQIPATVRESVLWPLLWLAGIFASFSVLLLPAVQMPGQILASLGRLHATGTFVHEYVIAPSESGEGSDFIPREIDIRFRASEWRLLRFDSNEDLVVWNRLPDDETNVRPLHLTAGKEVIRARGEDAASVFPEEFVTRLYVENQTKQKAQLKITLVTQPQFPQVSMIPITALGVVGVFSLYLLQQFLAPKMSAVALATVKSETAQPLFYILVIFGSVALFVFVYLPYHTFGEDIKLMMISALMLIKVLCIIQAVWAASTSVADEIEGRTALTVLSKPIGRRSFILGKFLGIVWTVALTASILGLVFVVLVSYYPVYEARETAQLEPTWEQSAEAIQIAVPGLMLVFMEAVVFAAIGVAISTRLPMLANFVLCFTIYALGHLTPLLVQSSVQNEAFAPVVFIAKFIATILPNLENFDNEAAVLSSSIVPFSYLGVVLIYCLLYSAIAMFLSLVLFEDRDVG